MKKLIKWKSKTAKKEYLQALIKSAKNEPVSYDKNNNYIVGDYINHFKFGDGFIQKVLTKTKIEVFFEDSEKVLMQNWQVD